MNQTFSYPQDVDVLPSKTTKYTNLSHLLQAVQKKKSLDENSTF